MLTQQEAAVLQQRLVDTHGQPLAAICTMLRWVRVVSNDHPTMPMTVSLDAASVIVECAKAFIRERGISMDQFLAACQMVDQQDRLIQVIAQTPSDAAVLSELWNKLGPTFNPQKPGAAR